MGIYTATSKYAGFANTPLVGFADYYGTWIDDGHADLPASNARAGAGSGGVSAFSFPAAIGFGATCLMDNVISTPSYAVELSYSDFGNGGSADLCFNYASPFAQTTVLRISSAGSSSPGVTVSLVSSPYFTGSSFSVSTSTGASLYIELDTAAAELRVYDCAAGDLLLGKFTAITPGNMPTVGGQLRFTLRNNVNEPESSAWAGVLLYNVLVRDIASVDTPGDFITDTFTGTAGQSLIPSNGTLGGWFCDSNSTSLVGSDSTARMDGSGRLYSSDGNSRVINFARARSKDTYFQCQLDFTYLWTGSEGGFLRVHLSAADSPSIGSYRANSAFHELQFDFTSTMLYLYYNSNFINDPFEVDLPAYAAPSSLVLRIEDELSKPETRVYINGTLVQTYTDFYATPDDGYMASLALSIETAPDAGRNMFISDLHRGVLTPPVPPSAFWTDYTGSILETV